MPKGVPLSGKRKRCKVPKEQYSTYYTIKTGLRGLLRNHHNAVQTIQDRSKKLTKAAAIMSRFINLHILRCLEEDIEIEELNQQHLQKVTSVLFAKKQSIQLPEWQKTLTLTPKCRQPLPGYSLSMNYLAKEFSVSVENMLVFSFTQRLRKFLTLRLKELVSIDTPLKEINRIREYIIRKCTFEANVYELRKEPVQELLLSIAVLVDEVKRLTGLDLPITQSVIRSNKRKIYQFYWYVMKMFEGRQMKSFYMLPLSGFSTRFMQIGTKELVKMAKDTLLTDDQEVYNIKCLKLGSKKVQIDSIRTDGIQAAVYLRHKLVGSHVSNKVKKKQRKKKKKRIAPVEISTSGIIDLASVVPRTTLEDIKISAVDPGILNIYSIVTDTGYSKVTNKEYQHSSHHKKNRLRLARLKPRFNGGNVNDLQNLIMPVSVSQSVKFLEHIESWLRVSDPLFRFYGSHKVARMKWDNYMMRTRTIDKIVNERFIQPAGGKQVVVAMGGAGFRSTFKGHAPVPKHKLTQVLSRKTCVVLVDEYLTTQLCSNCHKNTRSMKRMTKQHAGNTLLKPKLLPVRGIKQCMNTGCMITHDRDRNAAANILSIFKQWMESGTRPDAFCRKANKKVEEKLNKIALTDLHSKWQWCHECSDAFEVPLLEHFKTIHGMNI